MFYASKVPQALAAIAEHGRGDPVPGGGREIRIPGRLAIVVGVDVSTQPGVSSSPPALISRLPAPSLGATALMVLPSMATSDMRLGAPVPTTSMALRMTRSCMIDF